VCGASTAGAASIRDTGDGAAAEAVDDAAVEAADDVGACDGNERAIMVPTAAACAGASGAVDEAALLDLKI